ncbi:TadE/TadG family type IV pilus assembly protein [Nostocoides sp. HKS02]|uniref:TadE/TadG family type IV pilus assembly protein n=1 Tax=Nostocoides sp. HKS02 TaxID=1813880 RepID=UPI0012B4C4D0|nr:TadE/TadG family type IV pilus assembly protein [Tetrasphaera sp. HKS02]QGN56704.1 hypothetical protein GKE56_00950 [Tetrasphaera sp. HKS02]
MTHRRHRRERGAAAVEMAIVLPLLLLITGGIVDLGRMYLGEILVTNAARDGARMASLKAYPVSDIVTRAQSATSGITPFVAASVTVTVNPNPATGPTTCTPDPATTVPVATVTVKADNFRWMILDAVPRLLGATINPPTISATASMQC